MMIAEFDLFNNEEKKKIYNDCCSSQAWVNRMLQEPPFEDLVNLLDAAEDHWFELAPTDWKEALVNHQPPGDLNNSGSTKEQSGIPAGDKQINEELEIAAEEQFKIIRSKLEKYFL